MFELFWKCTKTLLLVTKMWSHVECHSAWPVLSAAAPSLNSHVLNSSVKFSRLLNHPFIYYSDIPGAYGHIHLVLLDEVRQTPMESIPCRFQMRQKRFSSSPF